MNLLGILLVLSIAVAEINSSFASENQIKQYGTVQNKTIQFTNENEANKHGAVLNEIVQNKEFDNKKSSSNTAEKALWISLVLLVTIAVIASGSYLVSRKKGPIKSEEIERQKKEKAIKELIEKIEKIENEVYKDFLAYAMKEEVMKRSLPEEVEKKIFDKYGRVMGRPVVAFSERLSIMDFRFFDEAMFQYLESKGYPVDRSKSGADNFTDYMLKRATEQAKEEIKKFL
jgi:hypothetical protein